MPERKPGLLARVFAYRNESLAVQSAVLIGARWVGFVLSFAIPIVLVRVFSQADFGIYKQLFLISGTLVPILNLGLTASLFYFVPRDAREGQRYVVQALAVLSVLGLAAGLVLALGAGPVSRWMGVPELLRYFQILAILVTVSTPSDLFIVSLPVVDRRPAVAGAVSALSDVVRAGGIILAAVWFREVEAVLWVAIAIAALRALWLLVYVRLRADGWDGGIHLPDLRRQFAYSLPFAAAVLFEIALMRFHEYYVASQVGPADFAIYAVGVFQVPLLGILVQSVVEVMLVRTATSAKAQDHVDMQRVWLQVVSFLGLVLIPSWVATQVWADDLILLLFGAAYLPAVPVFRVFLTVIPLMGVVDHGVLRATGDTGFLLKANFVGFVLSVITILLIAPYSVVMGAVTGLVTGVIAMRVMGLFKVRARLGLTRRTLLPWSLLVRTLVASAVAAVVTLPTFGLPPGPVRLLAGGTLFGAVLLLIAWSGWLIDKQELVAAVRRIFEAAALRRSDPAPAVVDISVTPPEPLPAPAEPERLMMVVSIDTEEDNWGRAREGVTCENIRSLPAHADRLRGLGVRPTFFATHQVAVLPWAAEILRGLDGDGCEVGSQLHPWNTPPTPEPFEPRLSMTKNLHPELQAAKVRQVTESVAAAIGRRPRVFRTGRWGFGPHVAAALIENGYDVDSSVLPFMTWERVDDGPSFVGAPLAPYRIDGSGDVRIPTRDGALLELPASCGFNRTPFDRWSGVYEWLGRASLQRIRIQGIAVRSGFVRRILLSPETASLGDMLRLSDRLIELGVPYLHVYWHSPTIVPGLTPFAPTPRDVDAMFEKFERYLNAMSTRVPLRFVTVGEAARELTPVR